MTKKCFKTIHRAFRLVGTDDIAVRGFYYPGREKLFVLRALQGANPEELWRIATSPGWLFDAARDAFISGRQKFSGLWDDTTSRITRRRPCRSRRRLLAAENHVA